MSLGGPAVGKGTQCKQLARKHGFHHISVGELLDEPSPFADFIIESKREYVIIPAQLTVSLLQDEMSRGLSDGKRVFVIDGFPRSIDQASYFDEIVSSRSIVADVVLTSLDFRPLFYNFVRLLRVGDDRTIDCQS
jgi:adenylate kinase family enzyme